MKINGKRVVMSLCGVLICAVAVGIVCFLAGGGTWQKVPTVAGIATVITAFFMGPLIQFFNEKVARPFLEK